MLEVNASAERNVNVVEDTIRRFLEKRLKISKEFEENGKVPPPKLVVLDEVDLFAFLRMENYPGIRTQIFGSLIEIPMNLLGKPMNFSTNFPGRPVS